jgi:uncharacterized protein (PEP-CTERM system associated)
MAITISLSKTVSSSVARAVGIVALALSLPQRASGAEWTFMPTFGLRESYSDNIKLASPQDAKSEWVSEFTPGIAVTGNAKRLKLNLAYQIQKIVYQSEANRSQQQLAASANAELLEDRLFVDARSSISQQNLSAFGPQLIDNIHISDNQSTLKANSISPYLRYRFNGFASTKLRYSQDTVSSDNRLLSAKIDTMALDLVGDNGARGWNWNANYRQVKNSDNAMAGVTMNSAAFSLQVPLTSRLNFFASTGYEKNDYQANTSAEPAGRFWSGGVAWTPSARTSVVASAGKRYFGNTYALNASHRSRNSVWNIGYNEDVTTTYSQFFTQSTNDTAALLDQLWQLSIPDPQTRRQAVDAYLGIGRLLGSGTGNINYLSHRYFLQKQLNLSAALSGPRSTLVLSLTANRRTAQTDSSIDSLLLGSSQSTLQDETRQIGSNAIWRWRMSARNSLNLSASYDKIKSASVDRTDNNLVFSAGVSRQLGRGAYASIDLNRLRHNSSSGQNYRENSIRGALNMRF